MARGTGSPARSTIIVFNTVERLLRGDFFHSVSPHDVRTELEAFPRDWAVTGLGTTNWYRRHGELVIDGSASDPRFLWADPAAETAGALRALDSMTDDELCSPSLDETEGDAYLPFAAIGVWDPGAPAPSWDIDHGVDVHAAIAERCRAANVGLAAVRVGGPMASVDSQAMAYLPLGGVSDSAPARAHRHVRRNDGWSMVGFYTANPTIRPLLGFPDAAVHLHGRTQDAAVGGHINTAVAASGAVIEVHPVRDLVVRIQGLDVATLPVRELDLRAAG